MKKDAMLLDTIANYLSANKGKKYSHNQIAKTLNIDLDDAHTTLCWLAASGMCDKEMGLGRVLYSMAGNVAPEAYKPMKALVLKGFETVHERIADSRAIPSRHI